MYLRIGDTLKYKNMDIQERIVALLGEIGKGLKHRRQGTKFYGLKIGHAFDLGWEDIFDEIVEIE